TLSYSRTINNDAITFTYKGSHQVPEPSSILSLLALGTLGTASTLKRKLKSSKSSEMEPTKVS
ncbi:MAG: PEP-CTERM sorting domain-containing protein, partial [Microcystis aeruginosa]